MPIIDRRETPLQSSLFTRHLTAFRMFTYCYKLVTIIDKRDGARRPAQQCGPGSGKDFSAQPICSLLIVIICLLQFVRASYGFSIAIFESILIRDGFNYNIVILKTTRPLEPKCRAYI